MDIKTFYVKFAKVIGPIAMAWWASWSNRRFKNRIRDTSVDLLPEDKDITTVNAIKLVASRIYKKFKYKNDGFDQLGDAIVPPPQNYQYYLNGSIIDDCDGFHSTLHYVLSQNNIKCYLLTANAYKSGHCILLFVLRDKWYTVDYARVSTGFDTAQEAITAYNASYESRYKPETPVCYNGIVNYNYETGRFYKDGSLKITQPNTREKTNEEVK